MVDTATVKSAMDWPAAGAIGAVRRTSWLLLLLLHVLLQQTPLALSQPLKLDEPITYAHHYRSDHARPNSCNIAHNAVAAGSSLDLNGTAGYVPFVGTSVGRDPQQLVMRLYYSTRDYPVKYFIVVVPASAMHPPHGALWYELEHLKQYADNVVIITCTHTPSVAEGWNAGEGHMHGTHA
jgi:hypothetical protein